MTRIKDIAEKAGVSTATVSYVLNGTGNVGETTRDKVLQVVKDFNYQPNRIAKSLKIKKTYTIGVIAEDMTVFNTPTIIDGINKYADENGWSIILTNMRLNQIGGEKTINNEYCKEIAPKVAMDLVSKQVDGIIYVGVHPRDMAGVIPDIGKPIVYTYCYTGNKNDYSINYNDEQTAYKATKYLINKGHEKIATICGLIESIPSRGRFSGFYNALIENDLIFNPDFVKTGDWTYESGYTQGKELLQTTERPTAILAMNDLMAAGVMEACRELNVNIPGYISVMGIDDRELSFYLTPRLTTMKIPLVEMGRLSIDTLSQLINHKQAEKPHLLECDIIERDSVGRPS